MNAYTLDMLLAQIGQDLPIGNGERYRHTIERAVKRIFRKIGYQHTAVPFVQQFDVEAGIIDPLPAYVLDVLDAGPEETHMRGEKFQLEAMSKNPYAFFFTPFGMQFPNLQERFVYLRILSLPKDPDGQVVIHDELYDACYKLAYSAVVQDFVNHPRFREWRQLELDALALADETRAQLNKRGSHAHNRTNRTYSSHGATRTDVSGWDRSGY